MASFRAPFPLGRVVPKDFDHIDKYPLRVAAVTQVEKRIPLPGLREFYDQGSEGACVGFSSSWMMSMMNRRRYDAKWLWNRAKEIDDWPETNPGDDQGTSVRAAMDILRTIGHVRVYRGRTIEPASSEGILENRWATTVDEVRACIASGVPVVLGVNWYAGFDKPEPEGRVQGEWWIGRGKLGSVRGGHAIVCRGASDRRQAVMLTNTWGRRYPDAWLPYSVLQRLLDEHGEATTITDR